MDAITYLKAKARMTDKCDMPCKECDLNGQDPYHCIDEYDPEQAIVIVEKWLAEHPPVTYASKMREVFPEFNINGPCLDDMFKKHIPCTEDNDCKACWNREYGSLEGEI